MEEKTTLKSKNEQLTDILNSTIHAYRNHGYRQEADDKLVETINQIFKDRPVIELIKNLTGFFVHNIRLGGDDCDNTLICMLENLRTICKFIDPDCRYLIHSMHNLEFHELMKSVRAIVLMSDFPFDDNDECQDGTDSFYNLYGKTLYESVISCFNEIDRPLVYGYINCPEELIKDIDTTLLSNNY